MSFLSGCTRFGFADVYIRCGVRRTSHSHRFGLLRASFGRRCVEPECARPMAARSPSKGGTMPGTAGRILVVGHTSLSTQATLQHLERDGWSPHCVNTIVEAEGALKMIRFDIVLAEETIAGGSGYDLSDSVLEQGGTLLVSVALSEASLWLPVIQRGIRTLGDRALNSAALYLELREALNAPAGSRPLSAARTTRGRVADPAAQASLSMTDRRTGPEERRARPAPKQPEPKRFLPPRRKTAANAESSISNGRSPEHESAKTGAIPSSDLPGRHFR